jgi:tetratricopeptide (TPR) repeat protein
MIYYRMEIVALMRNLTFGLLMASSTVAFAWAGTAAVDSGGTSLDLRHLAVADRAAYHGRYTEAISKVSAVIQDSPDFAGAYLERASYYRDAGRYDEALADVSRLEAFHPDASQAAVMRATIALRQHDPQKALDELARATRLPTTSFWKQSAEGRENAPQNGLIHVVTQRSISYEMAYGSIAYEMLGQDKPALDLFAKAMKLQSEKPFYVLNTHCYYAAIVGLTEMAELTCGEAIATESRDIGSYDSLGLAHLKMKAWAKAIDDYNHALYTRPDLTMSLYGRGIAKHAMGDRAGGDADIAAARHD